jgi:hypothetical protein
MGEEVNADASLCLLSYTDVYNQYVSEFETILECWLAE